MRDAGHGFDSRQHVARALGQAAKDLLDALSHLAEERRIRSVAFSY